MTLSQLIKLRTNNGQVIIDFLIEVVQDRYKDFQMCHRLQAAQLLNTYGNKDAPNFIDDNPRSNSARRNRSKASRQTKFDTELARVISEDTQDGRTIARFLVYAMEGEFKSFRPHHRISAARELLDRGFGKSARKEKTSPLVHPDPVEGPDPVEAPNPPTNETNEITAIPESQESEFRQHTHDTNEITQIPESQKSEFRQPTKEQTLTPHSSPLTPTNTAVLEEPDTAPRFDVADDTDYWLHPCDSPLHDFMSECEHPDFDPCRATIDEDYFQSFTACTDPECEVHGEPDELDFDPNDYHY